MKIEDITEVLIREGIREAKFLEDKLSIVARSVGNCIDKIPEGILYEAEVVKALTQIRMENESFLNETDVKNLSKPSRNKNYGNYGVKSITIRDAIGFSLLGLHPDKKFEVHFEGVCPGQMQQVSFRVILYKNDENLKKYILSRTFPYPKVVYLFSVPSKLVKKDN